MATRTQIYKEILREYDALRTEQAAKLRQRKEEIYRRLPRVREIDETLSMLGVQTAKLVLLKPGDMQDALVEMRAKQKELQTERRMLLESIGLTPADMELEYVCETCKDTGYVDNVPCTCLKQKVMDKLYDQSNVRDIVKVENFDHFDVRLYSEQVFKKEGISPRENAMQILRQALAFVENFADGDKRCK